MKTKAAPTCFLLSSGNYNKQSETRNVECGGGDMNKIFFASKVSILGKIG
jgi:hypothetical protein